MWALVDLLFLSVFSEHKIATVIVIYLYGVKDNNKEHCVSKIHNETINLKQFRQFLTKNSPPEKVMSIRASPFFRAQTISLRMISMGRDIWANNSDTK